MSGYPGRQGPVTVGLPFSQQDEGQFALAIRSIFAQDYVDWRLILVADGPSANAERASLIDDPRVDFIRGDRSEGLAARLNQIARLAETPLLFRMDADDVMRRDRLRVTADYLASRPELDLVGTRALLIDERDDPRGLFRESDDVPDTPAGYLRSNAFSHPTVAGRTMWFLKNPYDQTLVRSQDKALWLTSSAHSRFAKLPEPLLYYRVDSRLSAKRQAVSSRFDRVLLRRYGYDIDRLEATKRILASHVKQRVYAAMLRFGRAEELYSRKFEALPPADLRRAADEIEDIRSVPVPGWR